tara:strand:- start:23984 stop:24988 length:1005 start_codon:yes stop_codon:yes gene_type:complete
MEKIAVRIAGNLGDHLAMNRLIPSIMEKYENAEITCYSYCAREYPANVLREFFPSFYKEVKFIPRKDLPYSLCWIKSEHGNPVNCAQHLVNSPKEILEEMKGYDKFYELTPTFFISEYKNYDFDWYSRYYYFPKPEIELECKDKDDFLVFHLDSSSDVNANVLSSEDIEKLILKFSSYIKCYVIVEKNPSFYSFAEKHDNIEILMGPISEIASYISKAKCFVGIASGFQYFAFTYGIPAVILAAQCQEKGFCDPNFMVPLGIYPHVYLPLSISYEEVFERVNVILKEKIFNVFPYLAIVPPNELYQSLGGSFALRSMKPYKLVPKCSEEETNKY